MHNCLNKRRSNTYEISQTDEQTDLPQKLQKGNQGKYQELTDSTDAWWRSPVKPNWFEKEQQKHNVNCSEGSRCLRCNKQANSIWKEKVNQGKYQELTDSTDAWWRSLINAEDAWSLKEVTQDSRHYETEIDPRDFEGTSPKFTWE